MDQTMMRAELNVGIRQREAKRREGKGGDGRWEPKCKARLNRKDWRSVEDAGNWDIVIEGRPAAAWASLLYKERGAVETNGRQHVGKTKLSSQERTSGFLEGILQGEREQVQNGPWFFAVRRHGGGSEAGRSLDRAVQGSRLHHQLWPGHAR